MCNTCMHTDGRTDYLVGLLIYMIKRIDVNSRISVTYIWRSENHRSYSSIEFIDYRDARSAAIGVSFICGI